MREEVQWFAGKMEDKLKENDHKGGWKECSKDYLINELLNEVRELVDATNGNVIFEAVDIANYAMMIADNANREESE